MVKKTTKKITAAKNGKFTVEELLEKAEESMSKFEYELCCKYYRKALEMDKGNTKIMDALGEVLVDMGQLEEAKTLFLKSIELLPDKDAIKYMNLAQIVGGEEAIHHYNKGTSILQAEKKVLSDQKMDVTNISNQLSIALCSLAELYLTDACYDDNAEIECQKALDASLEHNPSNPDTYCLLASLRISQQRPKEESLSFLTHSYSLWKDKEDEEKPHYEQRYNAAKIFVELGEYQPAVDILEDLVEEEDCIAEVWHTMGIAYQGNKDPRASLECLEHASGLLKRAPDADESLISAVKELLQTVKAEVNALPEEEENGDENGNGVENGDEDEDGDEDGDENNEDKMEDSDDEDSMHDKK